jgi:hypothetical protein
VPGKELLFTLFDELYVGYGLLMLVCVGAGVFSLLYWYRHRIDFTIEKTLIRALNGGICLILVTPILIRFIFPEQWRHYFTSSNQWEQMFFFIPFLLAFFLTWAVGSFLIARWRPSHWFFLLCIFLPLFFLSRALYLYYVHPTLYSDFKQYWDIAARIVKYWEFPQTLGKTYLRRVLPIWAPLIYCFGNGAFVYKLSNVLFQAVTFLMVYRLSTRYFGRTAAQLTLWLLLFVPELLYSVGITSHDLTGSFLLLLFLGCYDLLILMSVKKYYLRTLVLAILAGLLWFVTDLNRSYGLFILLGITVFSLTALVSYCNQMYKSAPKLKTISFLVLFLLSSLVVPHATMTLSKQVFAKVTQLYGTTPPMNRRVLFTSIDNYDGTYYDHINLQNIIKSAQTSVTPEKPIEFWTAFSDNWFLSEYLYNHLRYVPQWLLRTKKLFSLGEDDNFYFSALSMKAPLTPTLLPRRALFLLTDAFMFFFLVLALMSMIKAFRNTNWQVHYYPPLLVLTFLVFIVLVFGEIQARYIYPIWLILPIYMGRSLLHYFGKEKEALSECSSLRWGVALSVFLLLGGFLAAMGAYALSPNKMLYMRHWDTHTSVPLSFQQVYGPYRDRIGKDTIAIRRDEANKRWDIDPPSKNTLRMIMRFHSKPQANDYVLAEKRYSGDPNSSYCLGGIIRCPSAGAKDGLTPNIFSLSIIVNGELKLEMDHCDAASATYVEIPGLKPDGDGNLQLAFGIRALQQFNGNWKSLSTANFSHFQLVKTAADEE